MLRSEFTTLTFGINVASFTSHAHSKNICGMGEERCLCLTRCKLNTHVITGENCPEDSVELANGGLLGSAA